MTLKVQTPHTAHKTVHSRKRLAVALRHADLRVVLMVLDHHTGDLKWLAPPYTPKRDVRLIPDPSAGLPLHVQDIIRAESLKCC